MKHLNVLNLQAKHSYLSSLWIENDTQTETRRIVSTLDSRGTCSGNVSGCVDHSHGGQMMAALQNVSSSFSFRAFQQKREMTSENMEELWVIFQDKKALLY